MTLAPKPSSKSGLTAKPSKSEAPAKKGPGASPSNIIGTRDESLISDSVKATLLKGLTLDDYVMDTPSAAIFTMVVGNG